MRAFLLLSAVFATALVAGCGGDDETTTPNRTEALATNTVTEATTEATTPTTDEKPPAETTEDKEPATDTSASEPSGGGDDGGGADDGGSGGDGGSGDEQQAQETALTFLRGLAGGDGEKACGALTDQIRTQIEASLGAQPEAKGKKCAEILALVASNYPPQVKSNLEDIKVLKVTVNGEGAQVAYRAGSLPRATMPLVRVDGEWKVGALATPGGTG